MKVLITCQYYWPDNFLINEIAEDLVKRGHQVTVLTGLPDYSTTKIPERYKHGKNRKEEHNEVKIIRVPIIARHHGFIMRVINYMSYFMSSSFYAHTHKIEADVIFAYQLAPILMVNPGMIYRKKLKKKMLVYVLDLWPDQMKIWHVGEKNPIFKLVLKYCRKAYGSGDVVSITSKPFEEYLVNICKVDKNKIMYLPQHADKMVIDKSSNDSDVTNLIFAGNIGEQQNIPCLLNAITNIKTNNKYHIHIYGSGTSYVASKKLATELGINDRVTFYGRVSKEELNNIYPKMDAFLLTLCAEDKIGYVAKTVPLKVQGYMSAGKPIIASINGGAYDIINESKCGIAVKADDYNALAKAIDDFIDNRDKYNECGKNAIKYFNENFEKNLVMDKLEKVLIDLSK